MGKIKALKMEAEEFAQDHFNMDRVDFYKHASAWQWEYDIQLKIAVEHWEEIQTEIALFDDMMEDYYNNPESPLYADNDLAPEDYNTRIEEGRE